MLDTLGSYSFWEGGNKTKTRQNMKEIIQDGTTLQGSIVTLFVLKTHTFGCRKTGLSQLSYSRMYLYLKQYCLSLSETL